MSETENRALPYTAAMIAASSGSRLTSQRGKSPRGYRAAGGRSPWQRRAHLTSQLERHPRASMNSVEGSNRPKNPLPHQRLHLMLDKARIAPVGEARRKPPHQAEPAIDLRQYQRPAFEVMSPPSKQATTARRATANEFGKMVKLQEDRATLFSLSEILRNKKSLKTNFPPWRSRSDRLGKPPGLRCGPK
jgi:hypothetical protein